MNAPMRRPEPVGFDGFLVFEDTRPEIERWSLVAGELIMMARGSFNHAQLSVNLLAGLHPAMRARGCFALSDLLVRNPAEDDFAVAPDVLVRCGPVENRRWVEDPIVAVEVLSPSTIDFDRGRKLDFYKRLPTLRYISLVYQDAMRVETYNRGGEAWNLSILHRPADVLRFEAVEFGTTLAAVYDGVTFD